MSDTLPNYLTADEQRALLDTFDRDRWTGRRNYTLVEFALSTGLRAGELVALRDGHLEFSVAGGVVHVREGKGGKDRDLEFSPRVKDLLRDWLRVRDARVETNVVFPTGDGTEMTTRNLAALVKKAAKEAGVSELERVSPHTLRHTFATELLRETGNLRLVQQGPWTCVLEHDGAGCPRHLLSGFHGGGGVVLVDCGRPSVRRLSYARGLPWAFHFAVAQTAPRNFRQPG